MRSLSWHERSENSEDHLGLWNGGQSCLSLTGLVGLLNRILPEDSFGFFFICETFSKRKSKYSIWKNIWKALIQWHSE